MGATEEPQSVVTTNMDHLLQQMTLEEKISLLAGKNFWETAEIERLGIPSLKVTDGPNGARGETFFDGTTAACFPACVSLGATFNSEMARRMGKALGQEAQTKGSYVLLGPTVCSHRSPLGGRNFEAFSEDPFLSGLLASDYVTGLQSERIGATVKHFLGNEQDTRRFSINEIISERALREIYMRPFEMVVKLADPWCIMTSYPKINGAHVDTNAHFVTKVLRDQWKFDGLVMSDWGATTSTIESINAGLDLEMPGPAKWRSTPAILNAVEAGSVSLAAIDKRARAVLRLLERTGKFSDRKITPKERAVDLPEHRKLIREAGAEGIVLLKNDRNILPLDRSECKNIALLGPLAKYAAAHGGGSASLNCHYKISPFDAFEQRLGSDIKLTYSKGTHIFRAYPDLKDGAINKSGEPGFTAEYFMNDECMGQPFHQNSFPAGAFTTLMDTTVTGVKSIRFTTTYTPPITGKHYLSYSTMGPSKLFIEDVLLHDQKEATKDSMAFLLGVQEEARFQYSFESGKSYSIRIEAVPSAEPNGELFLMDDQIAAHLGFVEQEEMEADLIAEAVALAKAADYAVICVGNTIQWETEGQDMSDMALPADGSQDRLIAAVAQVNPRTIVVNTTGVAVALPWLSEVSAFMQAWYCGQETGNAILDVILGEVNPSGKLPISWPRKYKDTAVYGHFGLDSYESREVEYVEGVYVGYRHFDKTYGTNKEVLFPFGFGLSYTNFGVSNSVLEGHITNYSDDGVTVFAEVENLGSKPGAEVIQAYLVPPQSSTVDRPLKGLVGFDKSYLNPGEKKTVSISFKKAETAFWDVGLGKWSVEAGKYQVLISTSSHPDDVKEVLEFEVKDGFLYKP